MEKVFPGQPIFGDGLRLVNFFNGRLLTAEDLTAEQAANRASRRLLGQALGAGVAEGFFVTAPQLKNNASSALVVNVDAGLAVNRRGDLLKLGAKTSVALTGSLETPGATVAAIFADCSGLPATGPASTGLFLLTISPASGGEGRAPTSGLGSQSAPCNTRFTVEGVQFHLIRLSTPTPGSQLRNILAYQSFGFLQSTSQTFPAALENPFAPASNVYGLLDTLPADKFPICHLPLALIYRTAQGIQFVDNWSVRRAVTSRTASQPWHMFDSPRRTSEMESIFLQFQEHLAAIQVEAGVAPNLQAIERFKVLPPAGFLPLGASGFDWRTFLGTHAPAHITPVDAGLLVDILTEAFERSPFIVEDPDGPLAPVNVFYVPTETEMADFVLFARSRQGRIRVRFDPPPTTEISTTFVASTTENNLEVMAATVPNGDVVFPDLDPGSYHIKGVKQGYKPVENSLLSVVGGRISLLKISLGTPRLGLCLAMKSVEGTELSEVRMCLVTGIFQEAAAQSQQRPWLQMRRLNMLEDHVVARLAEWQQGLAAQFPNFDIVESQPEIYVAQDLKAPNPPKSIPIVPKAYAVFGSFGIPLTVYAPTDLSRDPLPLAQAAGNVGSGWKAAGLMDAQVAGLTDNLLAMLYSYGIETFEQLGGAWRNLLAEATDLSSKQARELITAAVTYLRRVDG